MIDGIELAQEDFADQIIGQPIISPAVEKKRRGRPSKSQDPTNQQLFKEPKPRGRPSRSASNVKQVPVQPTPKSARLKVIFLNEL